MSASWRLEARGLCVRRGARHVLENIDLKLGAGESISIIGPNGAGKTTLLQALLGLLPAESGEVLLEGRSIRRLSAAQRGRFAAYVAQIVERLPAFRVAEVVATGRFPHVSPLRPLSGEDHAIVRRELARCGLAELADRPVTAISGGERQKTFLAAALAQEPQALFLDEPTTALDPAYQVELVRLLREWHAAGRAVVLVSHDLQVPAALGGRVVALRDGRVVANGPASELLTSDRLRDVFGAEFEMLADASGRRVPAPRWG
jgi:iron complex transport system ATP-binding protein